MSGIHPKAVVEDGAVIGDGVEVGPFSHIGPEVRLGDGVRVQANVVIAGRTSLGPGCQVSSFVALGGPPQDIKYAGEPTGLEIGSNTLIRESVTVHRGTAHGNRVTRIGSDCFLMVSCHVAHDCTIGDNVILINQATLAGHVEIGDYTIVGHATPIKQFCRIGRHAFIVAPSAVTNDVIPFGVVKGSRQECTLQGLNLIGLKHRGFSRDTIKCLREAYKIIFDGSPNDIVERARDAGKRFADCGPVMEMVAFITEYPERKPTYPAKRGAIPLEVAE